MEISSELLTLKRKRNDGWTEKGWPGFSLFPVARKKDDDGGDDDDL